MKGLSVDVYRTARNADCTNGGVTSQYSHVIVFDDHCTDGGNYTAADVRARACLIVKRDKLYLGGYLYAVPANIVEGQVIEKSVPAGHVGWMAGGNFVATSDSRFRALYGVALPVHDRSEDYELYRSNCD